MRAGPWSCPSQDAHGCNLGTTHCSATSLLSLRGILKYVWVSPSHNPRSGLREIRGTMKGLDRYGWWLAAGLVAALAAVQCILFSFGYRLTADDLEAHYYALDTVPAFFAYAEHMARVSGRLGHYLTLPISMAASYASDYLTARLAFAAVFFGSYLAFAMLLGRLMRMPSLTVPLFIAYLVCCPLLFNHTPPTAYPLQITLPFLVILLCRIYFVGRENKKAVGVVRLVFLLAVISGSEYTLLFAAGVLLVEHLIRNAGNLRGLFRSRFMWGDLATMLVVVAIYVAFRVAVPGEYGGNRPDGIRDLGAVLKILWLHTWKGTIFAYPGVAALTQSWNLFATAAALAVLAGAAVLLGPRSLSPGPRLVIVTSVALLLACLLVMLPPSTNKRLQDWCTLQNACSYLTSRVAYYFVIPAIFIPIIVHFERSAFALVIATTAFLGFSHNWNASVQMRLYVQPYKEAVRLACTIEPANAQTVLDQPQTTVMMHPWMDRASYWSRLISHERSRQGC